MPGLIGTFQAALAAFNDASTAGNYNAVGPFLDTLGVVMQHVDDPLYICGTRTAILNYLKGQIGLWPYLDYGTPNPPTYFNNRAGDLIGTITGSGTYQDRTTPPIGGVLPNPFSVNYTYIFRRTPAGVWLMNTALAHPS